MTDEPAGLIPCIVCGDARSRVVDTRGTPSQEIRRRRECPNGHRYTTYEAPMEGRNRNYLRKSVKHGIVRRIDEVLG